MSMFARLTREFSEERSRILVRSLLVVAIFGVLAVKWWLIFRLRIHWDEFNFLSKIYLHRRGELSYPSMTFHVHLFGWVPDIGGDEIDQVITGRKIMFGLRLLGTAALFVVARQLAGVTGALVAVLCGLCFSYVLGHGESFRYDPLTSNLFVCAVALLVWRRTSIAAAVFAGFLVAVAFAVSPKTLLYVPATVGLTSVLWWSASDRRRCAHAVAAFFLAAIAAALALRLLHEATLAEPGGTSFHTAGITFRLMFLSGFFPRAPLLLASLDYDLTCWSLLVAGAGVTTVIALRGSGKERERALLLLVFLLPLGTLLIYRNAWAYYYISILPLAALVAGPTVATIERLTTRRGVAAAAVGLIAVLLVLHTEKAASDLSGQEVTLKRQRQVIGAVREVFPEPVPYLASCAIVTAYPMVGRFESTFVLKAYHEKGEPIFARLIAERRPLFVIDNVGSYQLGTSYDETLDKRLLREDYETLKKHYIRHWGPIWVAGASRALPGREEVEFEIAIPGPYTVESKRDLLVDGEQVSPGSILTLTAGRHRVRSTSGDDNAVFRIGEHLPRPSSAPPVGDLF